MKRSQFSPVLIAILSLGLFGTSCSSKDNSLPNPRAGKRVATIREIAHPSQNELKSRAAAVLGSAGAQLVRTGIRVWRVEYKTVLPGGGDVTASGLILVPDQGAVNLTMLSYQHGTQFDQRSTISDYDARHAESYLVGSVMAAMAKGYYVVMPDYIGYGASKNEPHDYIHRQSLATASLDMLRAAKETAQDSAIGLNAEMLLAGYSEGGYATMALHKMIEETASGEFRVANSLPGAGPYDITATSKIVMSTNRNTDADFVLSYAWVALTYDRRYGLDKPLTDYFSPASIPAIRAFQGGDIATAMAGINTNPAQLFSPEFTREILTADHTPMLQAMKDNDIWDWKPAGKVTLIHSADDEWVPLVNAQHAYEAMRSRGANVELVTISGDHRGQGALQYFSRLFERLQ